MLLLPLPLRAQVADDGDVRRWTSDAVPAPDPLPPGTTQYDLFDPVPDARLRSLSTDRPGKTHSSITVDAGHFQVESDFLNYTYDHDSPASQTTRITSVATPILKAGIVDWFDLEIGLALYNDVHVTSRSAGLAGTAVAAQGGSSNSAHTSVTASSMGQDITGKGFGDVQLGGKFNIFGNDGGSQALAILPFVKIPTAARNVGNGVTEYAVDIPYTINLDTLWSLTLEPDLALLKNTSNADYHGDGTFAVNINRPVFIKTVTASLELANEYATRNVSPRYTLDPAVQWLVTSNLQLDMGIYIGLNRAAPDYNAYTGISFRY